MILTVLILGIIIAVMGVFIQIFKPAHFGYQLVKLPGYAYIILGVILAIVGIILG
jgi:glucose dehydrogenase